MGDVTVAVGVSQGKIHACNRTWNRPVSGMCWCWLPDDMVPVRKQDGTHTSPPPLASTSRIQTGYPFLRWSHASQHAVILGRKYFDRFGSSIIQLTAPLGAITSFNRLAGRSTSPCSLTKRCEHQHYTNGYGQPDALMRYTERLPTLTAGRMRKRETNELRVEITCHQRSI